MFNPLVLMGHEVGSLWQQLPGHRLRLPGNMDSERHKELAMIRLDGCLQHLYCDEIIALKSETIYVCCSSLGSVYPHPYYISIFEFLELKIITHLLSILRVNMSFEVGTLPIKKWLREKRIACCI